MSNNETHHISSREANKDLLDALQDYKPPGFGKGAEVLMESFWDDDDGDYWEIRKDWTPRDFRREGWGDSGKIL